MGRYTRYNKISDLRFKKIVYCFACNMDATEASKKTKISLRTVNNVYIKIRENITKQSSDDVVNISIDASEYYFGLKKTSGLVFAILTTQDGNIVTKILRNNEEIKYLSDILGIEENLVDKVNDIKEQITKGKKIANFYGLIDLKYDIKLISHIKGIHYRRRRLPAFFIYSRKKLIRAKGISRQSFESHLKSVAFLFNHQTPASAYQDILNLLKLW